MLSSRQKGTLFGAFLLAFSLVLAGCQAPVELQSQTLKDARPFIPRSEAIASKPLNASADFDRLLAALRGEDPKKAARAAMAMGKKGDPRALVPLVDALEHSDPSVRFAASTALKQFGSTAVDPLLDALNSGSAARRIGVVETLGGIGDTKAMEPLIAVFRSEEPDKVRMAAAEALIQLGDPAVIPPFVEEMMNVDSDLRFASADALVEMGEAAVEPLLSALEAGDAEEAWIVADTLGRIGDPRAAMPLIRYLQQGGKTEAVRMSVVRALGKIGDPSAVDVLVSRLKDPVFVVKKLSADAMVQIGEPAVDPLVKMLGEEDPEIQDLASDALARIGQPSVEPLLAALADADSDADRRWAEIATLGNIGDYRAVEPVAAYLNDPDTDLALVAVEALGAIGKRPPTAAPPPEESEEGPLPEKTGTTETAEQLEEGATQGETETATTNEPENDGLQDPPETLEPTGPTPAEALVGAIESRTAALGPAASEALANIGPAATGPLVAALSSENPVVRQLCSETLIRIGSPSVGPLLEAFQGEDERLREAAADTLTALGDQAVGPLANALPDEEAEGQQRIANLLAVIESPSAVKVLVDALQDWLTRKSAAKALDAVGWEPDSPEDRVHLWVGQDRRDALMDQWRITRYVLSKDLTSGSSRDKKYAFRAWIALGYEESIPEMLEYFDENDGQDLALMLLQSENPRLEEAAKRWFRSQRLDPEAMRSLSIDSAPPVVWGSMAQP